MSTAARTGNGTATAPRYIPPTRAQHRRNGPKSRPSDAQPTLLLAASRAEERFQVFMAAHPEVYREFSRRALALHRRGWKHFGAKAIIESLRYESALNAATPDAPWKLDNSHTSRLVRRLISEHPELAGFFEVRTLRSA